MADCRLYRSKADTKNSLSKVINIGKEFSLDLSAEVTGLHVAVFKRFLSPVQAMESVYESFSLPLARSSSGGKGAGS